MRSALLACLFGEGVLTSLKERKVLIAQVLAGFAGGLSVTPLPVAFCSFFETLGLAYSYRTFYWF